MRRGPQADPYSRSLAWSFAGHAALLALALLLPKILHLSLWGAPPPPMEVEITSPFLGDGPAKLGAPKPLTPGKPAAVNATALRTPEMPKAAPPPKPAEPPKEWVLPPRNVPPKPAPPPPPAATGSLRGDGTATTPGGATGGDGTAAKAGGSGEGSDEGVPGGHGHGGTPLKAFPILLNRDEVLAQLRKLYPEGERRAGREADVMVVIHIGADGAVGDVDVRASAGAAFDEAARKVGRLMRFSPAIGLDGRPTPVRLPQPIQFRLTQ